MVNTALTDHNDVGLQVEVYHYRASLKKEHKMA
jgi:hypothetical protein